MKLDTTTDTILFKTAFIYRCCSIGAIIVCISVNKFIHILGCLNSLLLYYIVIFIIKYKLYVFLILLFKLMKLFCYKGIHNF